MPNKKEVASLVNTKKKKLINNLRKEKKRKEYMSELNEKKKEYQEDHRGMIRLAHKNSAPETIYKAHKELAIKMRNKSHTAPSSRLLLGQEYAGDIVTVMAWVSDIKTFYKKGKQTTRILLDRPQIGRKNGGNKKTRKYDSHTWINIEDITSIHTTPLIMSVGDIVLFTASVTEYRGQIEYGKYGIKYGFSNIKDICSGYPFFNVDKKTNVGSLTDLKYDYPRHNEWILKLYNTKNYQIQSAPDYLNKVNNYNGWEINE